VPRPRNLRPVSCTVYRGIDGLWHGYLTVGTKLDGKPDRRHRTGRTEQECTDKIRQLEAGLAAGKAVSRGRHPDTVGSWLAHWLEHIAKPSVSYNTFEGSYAYAVNLYLIPALGWRRLDQLEADHIEKLWRSLLDREHGPGLSAGNVALFHRTLRAALNEAVRRDKLAKNPALVARSPQSEADEVVPLTADEIRRILAVLDHRRNGVRWLLAMIGPRQGEVLGLRWSDIDLDTGMVTIHGQAQRRKWRHGCKDPGACARRKCRTGPCRPAWAHGCPDRAACTAYQGRACPRRQPAHCPDHRGDCPPPCPPDCTGHAKTCPDRHSGGVRLDDGAERAGRRGTSRRIRTKSEAGTRRVALPAELIAELRAHRKRQDAEREHAGSMWTDNDLVFATVTGGPIDRRRDWGDWKDLLAEAGVRDVRVHDARHTAATLLLAKGVDRRVVMDIMGWSSERMLGRYQHVVDEMRHEAAARIGEALWTTRPDPEPAPTGVIDLADARRRRRPA